METTAPWEHGSEFAWVPPLGNSYPKAALPANAVLYGNGRQALAAALLEGKKRRGWRRCYVPSYICQSVVDAVHAADLECVPYPDLPVAQPDLDCNGLRPSDCVLIVNYFGWRSWQFSQLIRTTPAGIIEDHTHDPWSAWASNSVADFCIVSLRKILPLPDGGAVWSPAGYSIDPPSVEEPDHQRAALQKLVGMLIKDQYLQGINTDKNLFRCFQTEGESLFTPLPLSSPLKITPYLLERFPWDQWRNKRAANVEYLATRLREIKHIDILNPSPTTETCSFGVVIRCPTESVRDRLRQYLIERNIYPAVLWPKHPHMMSDPRATEFSKRILFFHADFRYSEADLDRVVQAVHEFFRC
ncbi:hypothetical protein [Thermogutta sp.]|uniref:hypothetical protein n=1 Tax=Thermogutta sp. TaxID=1962930 RepID=UPI003C7BD816